jgi:hypothetical protein
MIPLWVCLTLPFLTFCFLSTTLTPMVDCIMQLLYTLHFCFQYTRQDLCCFHHHTISEHLLCHYLCCYYPFN